jgi:Family of unknown function (DUF6069)
MSTTTTTSVAGPQRAAAGPVRRSRALTVAVAAAAGLAGWAVAAPLAGAHLAVRQSPGAAAAQVGPVTVLIVSLLAGAAGWALLAALERLTQRARTARTAWTATALVILALSLAGPLGSGPAAEPRRHSAACIWSSGQS